MNAEWPSSEGLTVDEQKLSSARYLRDVIHDLHQKIEAMIGTKSKKSSQVQAEMKRERERERIFSSYASFQFNSKVTCWNINVFLFFMSSTFLDMGQFGYITILATKQDERCVR